MTALALAVNSKAKNLTIPILDLNFRSSYDQVPVGQMILEEHMSVVESTEPQSSKPRITETVEVLEGSLPQCCRTTIDMHAAFNNMMVCSQCKQIIKCFDDAKAFTNYRRFCASRHRRILATEYAERYIVAFSSYDTFSS